MKLTQYDCSNEILQPKKKLRGPKDKGIAFEELEAGKSYVIPVSEANISSLQVQCSKYSKMLGKTFRLYYHAQHGVVEIGRVDNVVSVIDTL